MAVTLARRVAKEIAFRPLPPQFTPTLLPILPQSGLPRVWTYGGLAVRFGRSAGAASPRRRPTFHTPLGPHTPPPGGRQLRDRLRRFRRWFRSPLLALSQGLDPRSRLPRLWRWRRRLVGGQRGGGRGRVLRRGWRVIRRGGVRRLPYLVPSVEQHHGPRTCTPR